MIRFLSRTSVPGSYRTARWLFGRKHLVRFGEVGGYEHGREDLRALNREDSTFYGAFVPVDVMLLDSGNSGTRLSPQEFMPTGGTGSAEVLESAYLSWREVVSRFTCAPVAFADGVGRILPRAGIGPIRHHDRWFGVGCFRGGASGVR